METGAAHRERFRQATRDALACLSLANLYFLNVWLELANTGFDFFRATRPTWTPVVAVSALIVLLAAMFWVCVQAWRRLPPLAARIAAIVGVPLGLVLPAQVIHRSVLDQTIDGVMDVVGEPVVYGLVGLGILAAGAWLIVRTWTALHVLSSTLLLIAPLLPVLAVQTAWTQWQRPSDEVYAGTASADVSGSSTPTRIVVMVFDELDQRLAFDERPSRVSLPTLDRLRERAFNGTRAVGGGYLGVGSSIASMLSGERLASREPRSVGVRRVGGQTDIVDPAVAWAGQETLFGELKRDGWRTAVVGWYIPYCRLLGRYVDSCWWQPGGSVYGREEFIDDPSLPRSMSVLARRQLERVPFAERLGLGYTERQRRRLLREELQRVRGRFDAALDSAEVLYVHWPLPHPFGLDDTDGRPETPPNYLDNLVTLDRVLAAFEERLLRAGRWDDVVVVVTSDHSLRPRLWRQYESWTEEEAQVTGGRQSPYVPFIVKFPGNHARYDYDRPFTIAMFRDVIDAIAEGEVDSPAVLAAWLDTHRHKHPTEVSARAGQ